MREIRFLCLAVSRREGGNCIAGIDLDSGEWIRPINVETHGAFGDHEIFGMDNQARKRKIVAPLDILHFYLHRPDGSKIQPENWEISPASYEKPYLILRRFGEPSDKKALAGCIDREGPLLHSYGNRIMSGESLFTSGANRSLSIIQPDDLYWTVGAHPVYANKLRVEADFHFDQSPYCISVTDPEWEARCKRFGLGRHPHSAVAPVGSGQVLLTVSLAEVPFHGYHYKLVAAVICLPI
jgi:hypothetical protein